MARFVLEKIAGEGRAWWFFIKMDRSKLQSLSPAERRDSVVSKTRLPRTLQKPNSVRDLLGLASKP